MLEIKLTISTNKMQDVIDTYKSSIPKDEDGKPMFTEQEWPQEVLRRKVIGDTRSHKGQLANSAVKKDNNLIT